MEKCLTSGVQPRHLTHNNNNGDRRSIRQVLSRPSVLSYHRCHSIAHTATHESSIPTLRMPTMTVSFLRHCTIHSPCSTTHSIHRDFPPQYETAVWMIS